MESLENRRLLAIDFELLQDINTLPGTQPYPPSIFSHGNKAYFALETPEFGNELWESDGTVAGTKLLKDIVVGSDGSYPGNFTAVGDAIYFITDSYPGSSLWKIENGQVTKLKLFGEYTEALISGGGDGRVFLLVTNFSNGLVSNELWTSDGTSEGTLSIYNYDKSDVPQDEILVIGPNAYFTVKDSTHGTELWMSDGTTKGTGLLKDIHAGLPNSNPRELTRYKDHLYFVADHPSYGAELWTSDGTTSGTELVGEIEPGVAGSETKYLTVSGDNLYFSAVWSDAGSELGRYNPATGLQMVKDIWEGVDGSDPSDLIDVGGRLFFRATHPDFMNELWTSDGTPVGTVLVKDIYEGNVSSAPMDFTRVNNQLYFTASSSVSGRELWKTDSTTLATKIVKDITPGVESSNLQDFTAIGSLLGFAKMNFVDGYYRPELWTTDGSESGTQPLVFDLIANTSSYPYAFTDLGGDLLFVADDGVHGEELWKVESGKTNAVMVTDIFPDATGSGPEGLISWKGRLYFTAETEQEGSELWVSDGTGPGTKLLKDIRPGILGSYIYYDFVPTSTALYFRANDGVHGYELWKTDGTPEGTTMVKDISPDGVGTPVNDAVAVGDVLYFSVWVSSQSMELWRTDGTEQGTRKADPDFNGNFTTIQELAVLNDQIVFSADSGSLKTNLWVFDNAGTRLLKDIQVRPPYGSDKNMHAYNGQLYFAAWTEENGVELWKTDGTPQGTVLMKDIEPGAEGSYPSSLLTSGGKMFFVAFTQQSGDELWASDGTEAGTKLVKDINPGAPSSLWGLGEPKDGQFYFTANDGVHGEEIWTSDGTSSGTRMVKDLIPGTGASSPWEYVASGGRVFISAYSPTYGREIFVSRTVSDNVPPTANADDIAIQSGWSSPLAVLANDTDDKSSIDPSTVQIVAAPSVGTAVVQPDGKITYTSPGNYVGSVSFTYTVRDLQGATSNAATVTIDVRYSIHQNPGNAMDTNDDGSISPLDVLFLIDDINLSGSRFLPPQVGRPSKFRDVNGDRFIDPLDVLIIIDYLNNRGNLRGGGEGESGSIPIAPPLAAPSVDSLFAVWNGDDESRAFEGVGAIKSRRGPARR